MLFHLPRLVADWIVWDTVIFIVLSMCVHLYDTLWLIVNKFNNGYFCRVNAKKGIRPESKLHILQTVWLTIFALD